MRSLEEQNNLETKYEEELKSVRTTLDDKRREYQQLEEEIESMRGRLEKLDDFGSESSTSGSIISLWRERQDAVRMVQEQSRSEVEILKERLNDTEIRLNLVRDPLRVELKSLRSSQEAADDVLRESQQLWENERRRFVEQIEVMDERVRLSEQSVEDHVTTLGEDPSFFFFFLMAFVCSQSCSILLISHSFFCFSFFLFSFSFSSHSFDSIGGGSVEHHSSTHNNRGGGV
jgi:hypothetical protein